MESEKTISKPDAPWWRLPVRTWLVLALVAIVSLCGCLFPDAFDTCLRLACVMADFRLWPRWYFIAIVVVLACSVYWFSFYVQTERHGFDKRWRSVLPVALTGAASVVLFLVLTAHRFQSLPGSVFFP